MKRVFTAAALICASSAVLAANSNGRHAFNGFIQWILNNWDGFTI